MSVRSNSTKPSNYQAQYNTGENIDFSIDFPNRKIVANSFRLVASVLVTNAGGAQITNADSIYYDNEVGFHGVFSEFNVSTANQGNIQNLQHYPRLIKMNTNVNDHRSDLFSANAQCEGRVSDIAITRGYLGGAVSNAPGDNTFTGSEFSINPKMCLNEILQSTNISYTKTSTIRISTKVSEIADFIFGGDAGQCSMVLQDVKLCYKTVPEDGNNPPNIGMLTHLSVKQTISSQSQALQLKVPMIADSVAMSFISYAKINSNTANSLVCDKLPAITLLQFGFNGSSGSALTYQLTTEKEMLKKYLESLGGGSTSNSLDRLYTSTNFGLGYSFGQPLNLNQEVLDVYMKSQVDTANPSAVFAFFNGRVSI
jgi:hypothetical protein